MSREALIPILNHLRAEPSRTWSIIITVYGDAIVPRGGSVWLGTLLAFFKGLDISDGVVRTAMSRLAADGWLERNRVGRNSFYRLTEKGRGTFREASEHIYTRRAPRWKGHFDILLLDNGADRDAAKAALETAGVGVLAPGVWLAPGGVALPEIGRVLRLQAKGDEETNRALAGRSWPLDATGDAYRRFIAAFEPLRAALERDSAFSDLEAFLARILLIHEYRRIVLRDPILPAEILPTDWPGTAARTLCASVYHRLLPASERWLNANAIDESGAPLPANPTIIRRFQD
jgi:phenylacetic acid degradation operon negative regulatory protein